MPKIDIALPKNSIVGEWKIGKLLGSGGQGTVWQVRRMHGKSPPRALKACFADDVTARSRFQREIRLLRECASEHVLPLIASDNEWKEHADGIPEFAYYVAALCAGTLVDERAKYESLGTLLSLFTQACKAVTQLHTRDNPVIHRDLKPDNFLSATEPERVVIADFGIAKEQDGSTQLTEANEVVGSPFFRAPEVLNGGGGDERSDVYSMGRILEWLLTGRLPQKMHATPLPRGAELADDACDALDSVIAQATAIDPLHRFASIADLEASIPRLWLALRPRPAQRCAVPSLSPVAVYDEATQLARHEDWIGWRELEGAIRAEYPLRANKWRSELEARRPRTEDDLCALAQSLLEVAAPRFVLGLVGLNSRKHAVSDQSMLMEDLVEIEGWNRGGLTVAVEAPRTLLYLFHYLYGALCMHNRLVDEAVQMAMMPVLWEGSSRSGPEALWRSRDLTGWPTLLAGKWNIAWKFLLNLHAELPILHKFFPLKRDFEVALASYSMLLSLIDLSVQARTLATRPDTNNDNYVEVPPIFATMGDTTITAARQRVYANNNVVQKVATVTGGVVDDLNLVWPRWVKSIERCAASMTANRLWPGDIDLGQLGGSGPG